MFLPDSRPAVPLPRFSRHLNSPEGDGSEAGEVCVRLGLYTQVREAFRSEPSRSASRYSSASPRSGRGCGLGLEDASQELQPMRADVGA